MPLQPASGFFNDRFGITAAGWLYVKVKMKTQCVANVPEKLDESPTGTS